MQPPSPARLMCNLQLQHSLCRGLLASACSGLPAICLPLHMHACCADVPPCNQEAISSLRAMSAVEYLSWCWECASLYQRSRVESFASNVEMMEASTRC